MSAFKSVTHQGWHARKYDNAKPETNPYPRNSSTAKDWLDGWYLANSNQPWRESLRKVKNYD